MEQCLRIALWMFLLFGYLQAKPVSPASTSSPGTRFPFNIADMGFKYLRDEISCDQNVTFMSCTSPSNVPEHCYDATLKCFMEQLREVKGKCRGDLGRPEVTIEALEEGSKKLETQNAGQPTSPRTQDNASGCEWEKKEFAFFVNDIKAFVQLLNSHSSKTD